MRIQLCIFDMDGLLIDSESVWYKSASACSGKYGFDVPDELILGTMGLNDT
ncbi:MAG: HAD family phosphatase, partial [Erysipelotrichaceae bacterium]|nr:HAD family phosphatase [Erysipelotrichaceae bacterium]